MKFTDGMAAVEAVLFACGEPLELDKLAAAVEIEKDTAERIIERLNDRYKGQNSSFIIGKLGDSYQMMTRPEFARYIKSAMETRRQAPLTQAALEVLAIVAYNQPITRAFVDQVRGVDSSGVVRSLVERNLLEEHGRLNDVPGRPIAYRTTDNFLRCFGFSSLADLPPIPGSTDQLNLEDYEDFDYSDSSDAPVEGDNPSEESENTTVEGDNPIGEGDSPTSEGDNPASEGDNSAEESDNPTVEGDNPIGEGDNPTSENDNPTGESNIPAGEDDSSNE